MNEGKRRKEKLLCFVIQQAMQLLHLQPINELWIKYPKVNPFTRRRREQRLRRSFCVEMSRTQVPFLQLTCFCFLIFIAIVGKMKLSCNEWLYMFMILVENNGEHFSKWWSWRCWWGLLVYCFEEVRPTLVYLMLCSNRWFINLFPLFEMVAEMNYEEFWEIFT